MECPSDKRANFCRKYSHFVSVNSQLLKHVATREAVLGPDATLSVFEKSSSASFTSPTLFLLNLLILTLVKFNMIFFKYMVKKITEGYCTFNNFVFAYIFVR